MSCRRRQPASVLPEVYSKPDSIGQNALTSVMLMAMMRGDYPTMGQLMMQDKFHEPYRQSSNCGVSSG